MTDRQEDPTVLLFGTGDLTVRLMHLLASAPRRIRLVLCGRNEDKTIRYANLAKYAAMNMGAKPTIDYRVVDLGGDRESIVEVLDGVQPDLVFMGASLQAARSILGLPEHAFRELDTAELGPWLPMHLTLNLALMEALHDAVTDPIVVNGAYPDAVGPALASIGLAPHIGVGNVGNVVPGLTWALADQLHLAVDELDVRLVAHHYFSHHVHRFGEADGIPYALEVRHGRASETQLKYDETAVFKSLTHTRRRQGGRSGQQLTAASAARVVLGLLSEAPVRAHTPAPWGMTGGYPVRVSRQGVTLDLADGMRRDDAIAVNQKCQTLDGIADISNGVVRFRDENMAVMERLLGYSCTEMQVSECSLWASELAGKYNEFLLKNA